MCEREFEREFAYEYSATSGVRPIEVDGIFPEWTLLIGRTLTDDSKLTYRRASGNIYYSLYFGVYRAFTF